MARHGVPSASESVRHSMPSGSCCSWKRSNAGRVVSKDQILQLIVEAGLFKLYSVYNISCHFFSERS